VVVASTARVDASTRTNTIPLLTHAPVCADPVDSPSANNGPMALTRWTSTLLELGSFQLMVVWPTIAPGATGIGSGFALIVWAPPALVSVTVVVASIVCVVASSSTNTVPLLTHSPVCADPVGPPSAKIVPLALATWASMRLEPGAFQLMVVRPSVSLWVPGSD
jgi:hypothetical protein